MSIYIHHIFKFDSPYATPLVYTHVYLSAFFKCCVPLMIASA
jgi:hypothetical protein